ncbi:hypothetical protein BDF20DRAFT_151087 [Mycotypha africana]|uniref:uncharacterized protein n=1 Tax=Mycotypha africana TaxID=64632 RepID=UPI002301D0B9|nr:uncharacterized protein BDF20DRAFT_151087 [Mycotypha africana]KAI8969215.1 hypothetical protein BDF20DRAFT_151087 [Mycotypha africana]
MTQHAKWTRILLSMAVKKSDPQDLLQCMTSVIEQEAYKKVTYPHEELYYLIVVAWNEGITCYLKSEVQQGQNWCRMAFDLLKYLKDDVTKAQLEAQMNEAHKFFTHTSIASEGKEEQEDTENGWL